MDPSESTSTFENLLSSIEVTPDSFLLPSASLQAASLVAAKRILDPVVSEYSVFKEVVLKGLDVEQVWEQIRLVGDQVKRRLEKEGKLKKNKVEVPTNGRGFDEGSDDGRMMEESDSEEGSQDLDDDEEMEQWEDENEDEEMSNEEEISLSEDEDEDNDDDEEEVDEFPTNPEEDEESNSETEQIPSHALKPFKKDIHGLNDQFFSIDDFNRLTEQQDTLAENDEDNEDNEIDYFGDPDEQDSDSEEENPDEITYQDFYLPPPNSSKKRKRAHFEDSDIPAEEELDDEARTSRFQKDLFAEDTKSAPSAGTEEKLSKHAKRQALIRKEVEQLEQENISQKQWMYTGEASSHSRPKNSLLEIAEEIDVERSVKPVPLVTEERTKSLEEIIKQRILENQFNDVIRKLPPSLTGEKSRDIEDEEGLEPGIKSKISLAEIYEQEHLRRLDPENNPTPLSQSVKKQHEEIDVLWKQLSHQLDSLTSWRFIPEPEMTGEKVVANIPAVEMEDARPEAEAGQTSLLAPQEVYRPRARTGQLAGGGGPGARGEMSREEKARDRKREGRKREKRVEVAVEGGRKDVVDTLRKGGVKIIANGKGRGGLATGRGGGTVKRGGRMAT